MNANHPVLRNLVKGLFLGPRVSAAVLAGRFNRGRIQALWSQTPIVDALCELCLERAFPIDPDYPLAPMPELAGDPGDLIIRLLEYLREHGDELADFVFKIVDRILEYFSASTITAAHLQLAADMFGAGPMDLTIFRGLAGEGAAAPTSPNSGKQPARAAAAKRRR